MARRILSNRHGVKRITSSDSADFNSIDNPIKRSAWGTEFILYQEIIGDNRDNTIIGIGKPFKAATETIRGGAGNDKIYGGGRKRRPIR